MQTISLRRFALFLGLVTAGQLLRAGEILYPVTPQSLSAWSHVGNAPTFEPGNNTLVLPLDTQLIRSFATTRLSVNLNGRPVFGAEPDLCPVLEIGPAALVFMRHGESGTLALVIGEAGPVVLPFSIGLDANGRSIETIGVTLALADGMVTITLGEDMRRIPLASPSPSPMEVVLSSGRDTPWNFERLIVSSFTPDPNGEEHHPTFSESSGHRANGATIVPGMTGTQSELASGEKSGPASGSNQPKNPDHTTTGAVSTLEIYTPPVVRHGRSEAARREAFAARQN